jgi:hypothetical protein
MDQNSIFNSEFNVGYNQDLDAPGLSQNSDLYYIWAGLNQNTARYLKQRRQPFMLTPEEYEKITNPVQQPRQITQAPQVVEPEQQGQLTPGEQFARSISNSWQNLTSAEAMRYGIPRQQALKPITVDPNASTTSRFFTGISQGIGNWIPETVASLGGAAIDVATGNMGKGQNYSTYSKSGLDTAEGVGQTIGSFVPDIALAIATMGGSMAATSAAASSKIPALARLGRLAVGTGEATGLSVFGKAIPLTAQATRSARIGAAVSGATLQAKYDLPEYVAGRLNEGELATRLGAGALGGGLAAGTYANTFTKNLLADAAVNAATAGVSAFAPAIPGGGVFDPQAAWTEIASSVALGTTFGAYNALADARATAASKAKLEQQRVATEQARAEQAAPGNAATETPTAATMYRQSEELLFGETTIPRDADVMDAQDTFQERTQDVTLNQIRSIQRNPDGSVSSLSDAITSNNEAAIPQGYRPSALENAANVERVAYARALTEQFKGNEEALIQLLELDPEDAKNLPAAITNKWILQAGNGRGIAGIEERLAQAGAPSPLGAAAPAEAPIVPQEQAIAGEAPVIPQEQAVAGEPVIQQAPVVPQEQAVTTPVEGQPQPLAENQSELNEIRPESSIPQKPSELGSSLGSAHLPEKYNPNGLSEFLLPEQAADLYDELEQIVQIEIDKGSSPKEILNKLISWMGKSRVVLDYRTTGLMEKYLQARLDPNIPRVGNNKDSIKAWMSGTADEGINAPTEPTPEPAPVAEAPVIAEDYPGQKLDEAQGEVESAPKRKRIRKTVNVQEDRLYRAIEDKGVSTDDILIEQLPSEDGVRTAYKMADAIDSRINDLRFRTGFFGEVYESAITEAKMRTSKKRVENIETLVTGNPVTGVLFPLPGGGRNRHDLIHFIAEVEETPLNSVLARVQSGQRSFADGKIRLSDEGDNRYSVSLNLNQKELKLVQGRMSSIDKTPIDQAARAKAAEIREQSDKLNVLDSRYADAIDAVTSQSEAPRLYGRKMTVSAASKMDMAVEHPSEVIRAGESVNRPNNMELATPANWRSGFIEKLDRAQDAVIKMISEEANKVNINNANAKESLLTITISDAERALLNTLSYQDIHWILVSRYGPSYWRDTGDMYIKNRNLNQEAVAALELLMYKNFKLINIGERINKLNVKGQRVTYNPVLDFANHNLDVPDQVMEDSFKAYLPDFATAVNRASEIARAAGIENPQHVLAYAEWTASASKAKSLDELREVWKRTSEDYANWGESEISGIRKQIESVYTTDADVQAAMTDLMRWANHKIGAKAYQRMMSAAITGTTPEFNFNLRNFPVFRGATAVTAALLANEWVENLEDDESFAGIPGSLIKESFGGGKVIGYAAFAFPGFKVGMRANNSSGTKLGMRRRAIDALRRSDSSLVRLVRQAGGFNFEDKSKLSPEDFRAFAAAHMARPGHKYSGLKEGTTEFEEAIKEFKAFHEDSSVLGAKLGNWIGKFLFDRSSEGVLTPLVGLTNDEQLLAAKSKVLDRYIREPNTVNQRQNRERLEELTGPINEIFPLIRKKYDDAEQRLFVKSFVDIDRRMSDLRLTYGKVTEETYLKEQAQIVEDIKKQYFVDPNEVLEDGAKSQKLGEEGWSDFLQFQNALNPMRAVDYKSEISFSMGVPYWELEQHHAELLTERDPLLKSLGAASAAMDDMKYQLEQLDAKYNEITTTSGKQAADTQMPRYVDQRKSIMDKLGEYQETIDTISSEVEYIDKKINVIDKLDSDIQASQSHFYLYRHRDGSAPYTLRLQFDESTKLPAGIRREYYSEADAKAGESFELKKFIKKGSGNRRKFLMKKIDELNAKEELTDSQQAKLEAYEKEINYIDGVPDTDAMTDAELMRYITNVKILKDRNARTIIRKTNKISKQNKAALQVLDSALYGAASVRGTMRVKTMTADGFSPRYIKDKGNASLYEDASGNVIRYDDVTIESLVDVIDNMVDDPIDRSQVREQLEKNLTFKPEPDSASIYIDMYGLKRMVEQYLAPPSPNLIKRYNWEGYADPDGNWTGAQYMDWLEESINGVRRKIFSKSSLINTRRNLQKLRDDINFYGVNNGILEYLDIMQSQFDPEYARMSNAMKLARGSSRLYSIGTLIWSVPNMIQNRVYGMNQAFSHFSQNAMKGYGVARIQNDGSLGPTQFMSSKAEAEAFIYERQQNGEQGWKLREELAYKNVSARAYATAIGAMTFPNTFMKLLAKNDPRWADILRAEQRLRLSEGSILGSQAIRSGVKKGGIWETMIEWSVKGSTSIDTYNNRTSIMMSGFNAFNNMGITRSDYELMGRGNKNAAIQQALIPHEQKLRLGERASLEYDAKLTKLNDQIFELQATPGNQLKIKKIQGEIDALQRKRQAVATPESVLFDKLAEYITNDRNFEQGAWDRTSKSIGERWAEKYSLGILGMTMVAPTLRSANGSRALMIEAARMSIKPGDNKVKNMTRLLKNYAPILLGSAAVGTLLGMYAAPAFIGILPVADWINIMEEIYQAFIDEDEDKLTKMSDRQMYENMAADMAYKFGYGEQGAKNAREFVRMHLTEGMLKMHLDMTISEGGGLKGLLEGQGFSMFMRQVPRTINAIKNTAGDFAGGDYYGALYQTTEGLTSGFRRIIQSGVQLGLGEKLDKDGNIIIDIETGRAKKYGLNDAFRQMISGKPWKDTRSIVTSIEGGVPLYTPEDRQAWANTLTRLNGVKFGETLKSKQPGMKEIASSIMIAEKAPELQYLIRKRYDNMYRKNVEAAKESILEDWNNNGTIKLSDGTSIKVREMFATLASNGGLRSEYELKGKGAQAGLELSLKMAEEWGRTRAVSESVGIYFNGEIPVEYTSELMAKASSAEAYAISKTMARFKEAYNTGEAARRYRQSR